MVTLDAAVSVSMRCICEFAESGLRRMFSESVKGVLAWLRWPGNGIQRVVRRRGTIDRARHDHDVPCWLSPRVILFEGALMLGIALVLSTCTGRKTRLVYSIQKSIG